MRRLQRWQSIVLQTTALTTVGLIIKHEIMRSISQDESIWDDPVLKNYTSTYKWEAWPANSTSQNLMSDSIPYNATFANGTMNDPSILNSTKSAEEPSFYTVVLPQNIITQALLAFVAYYWNLVLEHFLPARPASVEVPKEKEVVDGDEVREEEIVRQWILKGRVKRSSISWWNTFLKWIIDLTLGAAWSSTIRQLMFGYVFKSYPTGGISDFVWSVIFQLAMEIFALRPMIQLVGFIIIPAPRRPVFSAGMGALVSIFISVSSSVVIRGIVKSDLFQESVKNATEHAWRNRQRAAWATPVRLVDEL